MADKPEFVLFMINGDQFCNNFITKLKGYFQKFKTKWAKVLAARKKTQTSEEDQ